VRFLDAPTERTYSARVVQFVALIGVASSSFTITVLSAALADIADDLNSSVSVVTWVIAAPLLAFAVFTPMAGKLGDLHGHRQMYLVGFAGAAVMSFVTASAWSAGTLIAARVVAQAFSASTGPSALAIIMSVFPESRRTHVAGTWSAVLAASPAVGVVIGGPLIELTSWRLLFVIQGIGMVVAVAFAWRVLPSTERRTDHTFDLRGGIFLALGIGSLLIAINRATQLGWSHPVVVAGLLMAPIWTALFGWWERRIDHPLVDLDSLRQRNVALPLLSQIFLNGPYMAGLVLTSLMLSSVFSLETAAISLMILPRPLSFSVGAAMAGSLVERIGGRIIVMTGTAAVAAGLALVGIGASEHRLLLVGIGVGIAGAGSGIARPPIIAALTDAVGEHALGVGTGMLNMTSQIGAAAGISILSALVTAESSADRYLTVFVITATIGLCAVAASGSIGFPDVVRAPRAAASPVSPYSAVIRTDDRRRPSEPLTPTDRLN